MLLNRKQQCLESMNRNEFCINSIIRICAKRLRNEFIIIVHLLSEHMVINKIKNKTHHPKSSNNHPSATANQMKSRSEAVVKLFLPSF